MIPRASPTIQPIYAAQHQRAPHFFRPIERVEKISLVSDTIRARQTYIQKHLVFYSAATHIRQIATGAAPNLALKNMDTSPALLNTRQFY